MEIFEKSGESEGYRNVAKIHIVCNGGDKAFTRSIRKENGHGVVQLQMPGQRSIVSTIGQKISNDLQKSGVLKLENGVFGLSAPSAAKGE